MVIRPCPWVQLWVQGCRFSHPVSPHGGKGVKAAPSAPWMVALAYLPTVITVLAYVVAALR